VPRLSLWKDGNHSSDYKFFDRRISEMFTIGGTGVLIHKYQGTIDQGPTNDRTLPQYTNQSEMNIQDLLFLENRDRKYDTSVYEMRGHYQVTDNDFDLTQFGLFLQTGTLFMTFHINDMISILGRKLMNGDVLEMMHLIDYDTLNTELPIALKRFFVVGDTTKASEGFSPTWWPHLWRCKINPMVDSQEYKDILNTITVSDTDPTPIKDILSIYDKKLSINEAILQQAEDEVPKSGYYVNNLYNYVPDDQPTPPTKIQGALSGDGVTPNGYPVTQGISFPASPVLGDFCLRLDYLPNRLFRYDGKRWLKIEDAVRSNLTKGAVDNSTLRHSFINNDNTWVDVNGIINPQRQNLNDVLRIRPDAPPTPP